MSPHQPPATDDRKLLIFFFNPCRIRLSINLRAVAKVDSRSLPPVAPRSNLTLPNPAVPRFNRRPQSHPRSGGRALLGGRPLSPEEQGRAGRRSRINPAGTSSIWWGSKKTRAIGSRLRGAARQYLYHSYICVCLWPACVDGFADCASGQVLSQALLWAGCVQLSCAVPPRSRAVAGVAYPRETLFA